MLQLVGGLNRAAWISDTTQASSACLQLQCTIVPSPPPACFCLSNRRVVPLKPGSVFLGLFGEQLLVWCHRPGWEELQHDPE